MKSNKEVVQYLCSMIVMGVKEKDGDCIRSHLEDLSGFLVEKNLIGNA